MFFCRFEINFFCNFCNYYDVRGLGKKLNILIIERKLLVFIRGLGRKKIKYIIDYFYNLVILEYRIKILK